MPRRMTLTDTSRASGSCLIPRLETAAELGSSATFMDGDAPQELSWARIHEDARATAAALQARGIAPGDRIALLGPTSPALVTAIQATWLAGAAVTVLPLRTRLTTEEEFQRQTAERIALTDATLTLVDPAVDYEGERVASLTELTSGGDAERYERVPDDPEAVAIVQFTSGSTADPKGVMIPHRCITDNLDGIRDRQPLGPDDVVVSWCPLYHDMGLVMLLSNAMTAGAGLVISTPQHFIAKPGRWMEYAAQYRGTWTIGPNFAFSIATRMLARSGGLDLSALRGLGNGSEPIDAAAMQNFTATAAGHGLDAGAMYGAYGMAEATVVISIPPAGSGFTVDVIDGEALERDRVAEPVAPDDPRARPLARCGAPIRDMQTRIVSPETGEVLGPRALGEIEVRGPSVVPGYFRRPDATAEMFHGDGWLRSGDLGYLADGELVICGRLKDVIVVGGRNVFPQDLEQAAMAVSGVRPGNVIAFGIEGRSGREEVVVVAEVKSDDPAAVRDGIARAVGTAAGIRPSDVVLLAPGNLPKTSSGKLRRSLCRGRYLRSELEAL